MRTAFFHVKPYFKVRKQTEADGVKSGKHKLEAHTLTSLAVDITKIIRSCGDCVVEEDLLVYQKGAS